MMMIWLSSFKADMTMKARLAVNGKMCKTGLDYNPDETYCGNVAATSSTIWTDIARKRLGWSIFGHTR